MRKHLKETLAEAQMVHTASRIAEAGLIDFSASLSDLGDMVAKLIIIGPPALEADESVHSTVSRLFAAQHQIDEAISAADDVQYILEKFMEIDFPE